MMAKVKFISFVPWVTIGSVIGSLFIVPMMPKIVDALYYKDKYNNDASHIYQKYIDSSYNIKIVMPTYDSKEFLNNVDNEKFPLSERFKVTYDSNKYFSYPKAVYCIFYCLRYRKCMNIISFQNVDGNYWGKEVVLTVNRDDMNNPAYGTKDNPVPVLKAVGVSEPIWFSGKDTDSVFMDNFYRNNVINYLKYKMPKEEFERRFKNKE
nr:hypothetical protein [uncultured Prevotella sp.]